MLDSQYLLRLVYQSYNSNFGKCQQTYSLRTWRSRQTTFIYVPKELNLIQTVVREIRQTDIRKEIHLKRLIGIIKKVTQ